MSLKRLQWKPSLCRFLGPYTYPSHYSLPKIEFTRWKLCLSKVSVGLGLSIHSLGITTRDHGYLYYRNTTGCRQFADSRIRNPHGGHGQLDWKREDIFKNHAEITFGLFAVLTIPHNQHVQKAYNVKKFLELTANELEFERLIQKTESQPFLVNSLISGCN